MVVHRLVAELHQGTCAQLTAAVAFPIGNLTRSGSGESTTRVERTSGESHKDVTFPGEGP